MSTAKANAVGHRWVGELADFRFDVKCHAGEGEPRLILSVST